MGGSLSRSIRLREASSAALIISLLAVFFQNFLIISAIAGTETGEFCPTCPDWTNLDGWLAKKDAYERAQMSSQQGSSQTAGLASNTVATAKVDPPQERYAQPDLITSPSSINSEQVVGDQVILDVRSGPDYFAGHIPGARSLYWKEMQKNGILDPALAKGALGRAGVSESDRLLIYGDSGEGASFVFWALNYLGHKNVSLLDGGADALQEAGVSFTTNAPSPLISNYTARIVPWLLVTPDNLESTLELSDARVLDARDFFEYGQSRLGNESICLSQDKLYENSRIKDARTLEDLFDRRLEKSGTAIVYGTPQAYSLFYSLRLMGYNATLLEGDWWKETKWAVRNIT
ncbi:MAG: thiosulfate/3-mercaptopyruvate sulfurtransferase [Euryarchaeota archaeon]|nr:thiosulfate/3-mercaptopyruvate sulfurtransferase [Euryarchaeota archaeon]